MSNNLQKIIEYGKDPSCVACISPMFGGAWHSTIRTGEGPQPVLPPVAGDSIAQRLGLLAKYNCDTSQLDFRLASTAQNNWYVKTGLSFAGWSRPLTIIGRMYIAPDNGGTDPYDYDNSVLHPLVTQGYFASATVQDTTLVLAYYNHDNTNRYFLRFTINGATFVSLSASPVTDPRGKIVIMAGTLDPSTGAYKIYENGVVIRASTITSLIGYQITTGTGANNNAVAYLHQYKDAWQNRNDRVDWCMVYDRVLSDAEIKFLSYDRDNWVDLSLPVEAGTINITTEAIPELEWTLPDGTKSTASTLSQTVEAGTLRMKCYKYGKTFRILSGSTALQNSTIKVSDLPRVTNYLSLSTLPGLTGTTADLPRVTNTLYLHNIPGLTGTVIDLPLNTGATRQIFNMSGIAGALPVVSTNTSVYYYSNAQVTPAEYDETIQNIVDAGGVNGTLRISNTRTSASDANIATLQSRGWTVTEH